MLLHEAMQLMTSPLGEFGCKYWRQRLSIVTGEFCSDFIQYIDKIYGVVDVSKALSLGKMVVQKLYIAIICDV
jgi:hypothetical protein